MKKHYKIYIFYTLFVVAYLILVWITPSNHNPAVANFNLSPGQLHIISMSIAVPLLAIWFVAFYGYVKLADYARMIKKSADGKAVAKLVRGIGALALALPLVSVISSALNYIGQTRDWLLSTTAIINSYTNLVLPLIAFLMIGWAAHGLLDFVKERRSYITNLLAILVLTTISIIYSYSTYRILNGHNIAGFINHKIYYQPLWLVIATIVIPYVFMWSVGGIAALDINSYSQKSAGVLYRRNWNYLSAGVTTIIVAEIIEQYLTSLSSRLSHIHLTVLLLIIYLLLIIVAIGFILIAVGANRLRKIEAV